MSDNITNQNISLHPLGDTSTFLYPRGVKNLTIAFNLVVNSNGSQFPDCRWSDVNELVVGNKTYYYRVLMQNNNVDPITDMSTIKAYMKMMTGSDYVPVYSANEPNDEFVFLSDPSIADENRAWKYQYDTNYGVLQAFRVDNFPFALKSQVKEFPKTLDTMAGITDAEYHRIYFEIYDEHFSDVKSMSIRIVLEENDKNNWGNYYAETLGGSVVFKSGEGILQTVNCRIDSVTSTSARFELLIDSSNPQVNLSDVNFANAVITLY